MPTGLQVECNPLEEKLITSVIIWLKGFCSYVCETG